jgi:DNA-binding transcriptional ArsR family regulator
MNAFDVLAEPSRRQILDLVREEERSVNELVIDLSMSQPAVSKHLRILRDNGFVRSRVDGQRRMYSLDPKAFIEVEDWLEPYRRLWEDRLDALQRYLDDVQRDEAVGGDGDVPQT